MKKIIAIFTLFLAFSFTANAQKTSKTNSVKTESSTLSPTDKNIQDLLNNVKMDESLAKDMTTLLKMREEAVNNAKNEADKKATFDSLTRKLLGGLNAEQTEMLKNNKELYTRLTVYSNK